MLNIRLATLADLDGLCAVEQAAFDPAHYPLTSRRMFRHMLTKGNVDILIACEGKRVVGSAVIFYRSTSKFGRFYSLAVHPEFQGQSVGRMLFEGVEKHIAKRKFKGILCEIRADNDKLYQRYTSIGYKPLHRLKDYYPDGSEGIKMRKIF